MYDLKLNSEEKPEYGPANEVLRNIGDIGIDPEGNIFLATWAGYVSLTNPRTTHTDSCNGLEACTCEWKVRKLPKGTTITLTVK